MTSTPASSVAGTTYAVRGSSALQKVTSHAASATMATADRTTSE